MDECVFRWEIKLDDEDDQSCSPALCFVQTRVTLGLQ